MSEPIGRDGGPLARWNHVFVAEMDSESKSWIGLGRTRVAAVMAIVRRWNSDPGIKAAAGTYGGYRNPDTGESKGGILYPLTSKVAEDFYGVKVRLVEIGKGYEGTDEGEGS